MGHFTSNNITNNKLADLIIKEWGWDDMNILYKKYKIWPTKYIKSG